MCELFLQQQNNDCVLLSSIQQAKLYQISLVFLCENLVNKMCNSNSDTVQYIVQ